MPRVHATAAQRRSALAAATTHNRHQFTYARRDSGRPYPSALDVYVRSDTAKPGEDGFKDLFLNDFVIANKRVARRKLASMTLDRQPFHLLLRGVQPRMDVEENQNGVLETALGYAGAVGVTVMDELAHVNEKVGDSSNWF